MILWGPHSISYTELGEFSYGWEKLRENEKVDVALKKNGSSFLEMEKMKSENKPIFIFSMCKARNDRKMIEYALSKYPKQKCAMLPIKGGRVYELVNRMMCENLRDKGGEVKHFLLPCLYEEKDSEEINRLIDFAFGEYLYDLLENRNVRCGYSSDKELMITLMWMICTMIKGMSNNGTDLSYEKEVRLIVIGEKAMKDTEMIEFGFEKSDWESVLGEVSILEK